MQDQITNNLQQPRNDLQQGGSGLQQSTSPAASSETTSILNTVPAQQLQVQSLGQPRQAPLEVRQPESGFEPLLLLLFIPLLLMLVIFLPRKNTQKEVAKGDAVETTEPTVVAEPKRTKPKKKQTKRKRKR